MSVPEPSTEGHIASTQTARSQVGCASSFGEYLRENPGFLSKLFDYAERRTLSRSDDGAYEAYSAACDALCRVWDKLEHPKAFARLVIRRSASKQPLRSDQELGDVDLESFMTDRASNDDSPLENLARKEERERVADFLAQLSVVQREAVEAWREARSIRQAAARLGVPEATFRKRYHAAVERLQVLVDAEN